MCRYFQTRNVSSHLGPAHGPMSPMISGKTYAADRERYSATRASRTSLLTMPQSHFPSGGDPSDVAPEARKRTSFPNGRVLALRRSRQV